MVYNRFLQGGRTDLNQMRAVFEEKRACWGLLGEESQLADDGYETWKQLSWHTFVLYLVT